MQEWKNLPQRVESEFTCVNFPCGRGETQGMDFSFPSGLGASVKLGQVYAISLDLWSANEKLEGPGVSRIVSLVYLGSESLEGSQWGQSLLNLPVSYLSHKIPML